MTLNKWLLSNQYNFYSTLITPLPNDPMLNILLNMKNNMLYEENRKSGNVMQLSMDSYVSDIYTSSESIYAKSKSDKTREFSDLNIYTTNVGLHRLLHGIPRFLIIFLEELFLIFNRMLSIGSFGRRAH